MRKNKLTALFVIVFVLCILSSFAVSAKTYTGSMNENISWSFDLNTGALYVYGSGDMPDYPNFLAPPYSKYMLLVRSVRVSDGITKIGSCSFMYAQNLKQANLPDSLDKIGDSAFEYCTGLENVTLPDGVSSVGTLAFANCTNMNQINFPASVTNVGSYAFSSCQKLQKVLLSKLCITQIGEGAFSDCTSLSYLSLPETLEKIGEGSFYNCSALSELSFPSSLAEISDRAFFGSTSLSDCTFLSSPTVGKDAFYKTNVSFTVTFKNYDGQALYTYKALPGEQSKFVGFTPERPSNAQYNYSFIGWNPSLKAVFSDMVYTAQFSGGERTYTVSFYDESGETLLGVCSAAFGNAASLDTVPTKESDAVYKYTFVGWDKDVSNVMENMSVKAVFEKSFVLYDVTFVTDGKSSTKQYKYGETPSFDGSTDKAPDAQYTYSFTDWDKEITAVTASVVYTARYSLTLKSYEIKWNVDGKIYTTTVPYGEIPSYGATAKLPDSQYTYTFSHWSPEVTRVTENAVYTAVYTKMLRKYSIYWMIDGTRYSNEYDYGTTPVCPYSTEKNEAIAGIYSFVGWSSSLSPVTGQTEYKALYEIAKRVKTVDFEVNSDDSASVLAELSLSDLTNSSAVVTLALYDDIGRMIGAKTVGVNRQTTEVTAKIELDGNTPYTAKAFVTDGKDNLIPICASGKN